MSMMRSSARYNSDPKLRNQMEALFEKSNRKEALKDTIDNLKPVFKTEASVSLVPSGIVSDYKEEPNLIEMFGDSPQISRAYEPLVRTMTPNDASPIQDFFRRQRRIFSHAFSYNTQEQFFLNPLDLFLSSPAVRAKLRNFSFLRGDLHIRVRLTGNPFSMARIMVSPVPMAGVNQVYQGYANNVVSGSQKYSVQDEALYTYMSQYEGTTIMETAVNKSVDIVMPYLAPAPFIRLFDPYSSTALPAGSPYPDAHNLTGLFIGTLSPVNFYGVSTSYPYMEVTAWMENVEISVPTGSLVAITTESKDERKTGPIETWSSAFLNVTESLEKVPEIGPWAMASSIVLRGVNALSSLFGWSYPIMIEKPMRVKNEPFQNGANTIGYDTGKMISLDPKCEVTVDPRILGSEIDPLDLTYLSGINSFLTTFTWSDSDAPFQVLHAFGVNPQLCRSFPNPNPGSVHTCVQPTALAFASKPFTYWYGTLEFTFDVVVASMTRGKLLIGFEPNIAQCGAIFNALDLNKQHYVVIDLQETHVVTICVPWAFHLPFAQVATVDLLGQLIRNDGNFNPTLAKYCNGAIFVAPLTELQSGDAGSVSINTFVRGKDMNYVYPDGSLLPHSRHYFTAEAEVVPNTSTEKFQFANNCAPANKSNIDVSKANLACFGECVKSFRSILKRFAFAHYTSVPSVMSAGAQVAFTLPTYPLNQLPLDAVVSPGDVNLFSYLYLSYLGYRGSMRHRVRILGCSTDDFSNQIRVSNTTATTSGGYGLSVTVKPVYSVVTGSVEYAPATNAGVEFTTPYYSPSLWNYACSNIPQDTLFFDNYLANVVCSVDCPSVDVSSTVTAIHEVASGEDYSIGRFLAAAPYSW